MYICIVMYISIYLYIDIYIYLSIYIYTFLSPHLVLGGEKQQIRDLDSTIVGLVVAGC